MKQKKQAQVLEHLKSGRSITVGECYYLYRTHDCRRIISRLRQAGHIITDKLEVSPDGMDTYKRYFYGCDNSGQIRMAL